MQRYKDKDLYIVYNVNTHIVLHTSHAFTNKVYALVQGGGISWINASDPTAKDTLNEINIINETKYGNKVVLKMDKTIYYTLRSSRDDLYYLIILFHIIDGEVEKIASIDMPSTLDPDWELIKWLDKKHNDGNKFNFKLKELN